MESQTTEQTTRKKSVYNKELYEQNKEEILTYRRERYRIIHKKDLNIRVQGLLLCISIELLLYIVFILLLLCYNYYLLLLFYKVRRK